MADDNFPDVITRILGKMDQYEGQLKETNSLLRQMLGQQQMMFDCQQQINQRQEEFNKRQEQFNERQEGLALVFLEEIRDIKGDLREIKKTVFENHEERLRRLEEFMRRAS